jgi:urease accessory protein
VNFLLWQLIDSGFPSGGFAHSGGLEANALHGHVEDAAGVLTFARQALAQAGHAALPIVTAVHQDPGRLLELDRLSDVFLSNPVANRASRAQGRALLASVSQAFYPARPIPMDAKVSAAVPAHHAPVFGVVFHSLEIDLADTQRAFLFTAVRSVVSAGVRLGLLGAYQAQKVQLEVSASIDRVIERCGSLEPADIAQTAPLADLCQSTHDRLYSRLFQS